MKRIQLELSSEQTLRLKELRDILAEAVPADTTENVEFPVAHYACIDCAFSCSGTCVSSCAAACWDTCTSACGGCGGCGASCMGSCDTSCTWSHG